MVGFGDDCNPEIVDALLYLQRYRDQDPRIPTLFAWVVETKLDFPQEEEKTWVSATLRM